MTLYEYNTICARMGAYCERVYRQENLDGEICPKVSACDVQTLEGYELELMKGYNTNFSDIKRKLDKMKDNAPGVNEVERYRQNFAIYGTIQSLIDDIKANKVYCPQKAQKRIIGSLERLYQMFFSVSQMCFAEFDGFEKSNAQRKKKSLEEKLIENKEILLESLTPKERDCLDEDFKWIHGKDNCEIPGIVEKIKGICLKVTDKEIESYWGLNGIRKFRNYYKA